MRFASVYLAAVLVVVVLFVSMSYASMPYMHGEPAKVEMEHYIEVNGRAAKVSVSVEVENNVVHYEYEMEGHRKSIEIEVAAPGSVVADRNGLRLQLRVGQAMRELNLVPPEQVLEYIRQRVPGMVEANVVKLELEVERRFTPDGNYMEVPVYRVKRKVRGALLGLIPVDVLEEVVCPAVPEYAGWCETRRPWWAFLVLFWS